jgi:replicative DNA helicase
VGGVSETVMEPPHSPDAEASVVGQMLAAPTVVGPVIGTQLLPDHFFLSPFRALYHATVESYYAEEAIDALTIGELSSKTLARTWSCDERAAVRHVQKLAAGQRAAAVEAVNHARLVRRHFEYRELLELAATVQRTVGLESQPPDELAAAVSEQAMRIATSMLLKQELVTFADLGRCYLREQQKLRDAHGKGVELGVRFGLPCIDRFTGGLRPGELFFLAGEPGAGKSAVSWKAAQRYAEAQLSRTAEERVGTLLMSLEMGEEPAGQRFAQGIAELDGSRLRDGSTTDSEYERLRETWKHRKDAPLVSNFTSNMRMSQLRAMVVEAIRRHNVGLVIIDHWKYLDSDHTYRDPLDEDNAKARFLKQNIAKELNVVVMCLAHTTKGASQRDDRRPRMADLRGSGYIAAHADFITFVHRPYKHATPDQIDDGEVSKTDAELIWDKARHGAEGIAPFFFDPSTLTVK